MHPICCGRFLKLLSSLVVWRARLTRGTLSKGWAAKRFIEVYAMRLCLWTFWITNNTKLRSATTTEDELRAAKPDGNDVRGEAEGVAP
jgi:hypothetical protein